MRIDRNAFLIDVAEQIAYNLIAFCRRQRQGKTAFRGNGAKISAQYKKEQRNGKREKS
jgi:hypothetical protein